jgi:CRP-like cAMP-binding protein
MSTRKEVARRKRAVDEALATLQQATGLRAANAAERIRVARAYRVLGDTARAATWYRSAVDQLSAHGEAVKALALAKEMSELMPQEQRAFAHLADRFAKDGRDTTLRIAVPLPKDERPAESPVLDASELLKVYEAENLGANSAPLPSNDVLPSLVPPDVLEELHARGEIDLYDLQGNVIERPEEEQEISDADIEVVEEAEPDSGTPVDAEEAADALQGVPLFSDLGRDAFLELSRAVKLRTVGDRCYVFREGEEADSFFMLAEGSVEVVHKTRQRHEVALRHFDQGEVFGLFGLIAGQKRAASVRAIGNVSVLEVPAGALANVMSEYPAAKAALSRFYEQRLLETFLASSPIFEDLDAIARGLLIGQFRERKLAKGENVVAPGEVFNGLFLVVSGGLEVKKRVGGATENSLAQLGRGQFFGVVSALSGNPCRCNITTTTSTILNCLTQKPFNDFVKDYPVLRQLPQRLAHEGMLVEKDVFVGDMGIPGLS